MNPRQSVKWNATAVPDAVATRALENADMQPDGCLISRYSLGSHGYAQIGWWDSGRSRMVLAHRAAWTAVHGQVPAGMTLDHICKVRRCVNPEHLRLLSNLENARRTNGQDWPVGTCRNGHPDTERVIVTRRSKSGEAREGSTCGVCVREAQARYRQSMKAA